MGDRSDLEVLLLDVVPDDGASVGNKSAIEEFTRKAEKREVIEGPVTEEDYWRVRDSLIEEGVLEKGRGRGGSVSRADETAATTTPEVEKSEGDLYRPLSSSLVHFWTKNNGIDDDEYISEITARQGARDTGGQWTRPDLSIVAVQRYPFIPQKVLDVVTFEVKPLDSFEVQGVFETAAHSAFAHRSYLVIHASDIEEVETNDDFLRIKEESERFDLGLILFEDGEEWSSFELFTDAERRDPDPADVNDFINKQISDGLQGNLLEMMR